MLELLVMVMAGVYYARSYVTYRCVASSAPGVRFNLPLFLLLSFKSLFPQSCLLALSPAYTSLLWLYALGYTRVGKNKTGSRVALSI